MKKYVMYTSARLLGCFFMEKRMNAVKNLSIRLQAVGGDKVRQEFKSLGTDSQKAFRQITQVITPANDNLKALSDTAKTFNGVLKQAAGLVGAYAGLSVQAKSAVAGIAMMSRVSKLAAAQMAERLCVFFMDLIDFLKIWIFR